MEEPVADLVGIEDGVAENEAVMEAVTDAVAPVDSDALGNAVLVLVCVKPREALDVVEGVGGGVGVGVIEGLKPRASDVVPEGVRVAVLERVPEVEGVGSVYAHDRLYRPELVAPKPCTTTYTKRCVTEGIVMRDCRPDGPQPAVDAEAKLQPNASHVVGHPKPANSAVLMGVKPRAVHVLSSSGYPRGASTRSIASRCCDHAYVASPVAPHQLAPNSDGEPTGKSMKPVEPRVPR